MTERMKFIVDHENGLTSMTELCARYSISRKTGYKWVARYRSEGIDGLKDRPRAPKSCPHRMDPSIAEALLVCRRQHPTWGPRKLLAYLARRHPDWKLPAASTVGDLLKREGLVAPRRRRRSPAHPGRAEFAAEASNDLWSIDFKGHFRTRDGRYCYPLTVVDRHSRYLLDCHGLLSPTFAATQSALESLFREYGLPEAILSDNGTPFSSSRSLGRLSRLSAWWIKLGIEPLLIEPGKPQQNGGHERMHRTLKEETTRPPGPHLAGQQDRFDTFRALFNEERPHEALDQRVPADVYEPALRSYPRHLPELEYPGHFETRRVRTSGEIKWQGRRLYVSEALVGDLVGLTEIDDAVWALYFGPRLIARFDERTRQLVG